MELKNGTGQGTRLVVRYHSLASGPRAKYTALAGEVTLIVAESGVSRGETPLSPQEAIAVILEFAKRYPEAKIEYQAINGDTPDPAVIEKNMGWILETSEESLEKLRKSLPVSAK